MVLFVGLIIIVDETNNLTNWFLSTNDDPQSFNGVELTKSNGSLVVSYRDGRLLILLHSSYCETIATSFHCCIAYTHFYNQPTHLMIF